MFPIKRSLRLVSLLIGLVIVLSVPVFSVSRRGGIEKIKERGYLL